MKNKIVRTALAFLAGFVFLTFLVPSKNLAQAAEDYWMERNRLEGAIESGYRRIDDLAKRRDEAMEKGDRKAMDEAQRDMIKTAENLMELEAKDPMATEAVKKRLDEQREGDTPLSAKLGFILGEGIRKVGETTGLTETKVDTTLAPDERERLALEAGYRRTAELAKRRDEAMEKGDHKTANASQQEMEKTLNNILEIERKNPDAAKAVGEKLRKEDEANLSVGTKVGLAIGDLIKQVRGPDPHYYSSDSGANLPLDKGREKKAEGKPGEKAGVQGGEGAKESGKETVKEGPKEPAGDKSAVTAGQKTEGEWTTLTAEGVQKEIGKTEESLAEYAAKIKEQEGKLGLLDTQIQGIEDDWGRKTRVLAEESGRLKTLSDQLAQAGKDTSSVTARFEELLGRQRVIDHERVEKMGPLVEVRQTTENEMQDLAFHRDNMENERSHFEEVLGLIQEKSVEMSPEPEGVNVDADVDALLLEASDHSPFPGGPSEEEHLAVTDREASLLSGEMPVAEEKSAEEPAAETHEMMHEPMDQTALPEIEEEVVEEVLEDLGDEEISQLLDAAVEAPNPAEIAREVSQQAAEDKIVTDEATEVDAAAAHNPDMM